MILYAIKKLARRYNRGIRVEKKLRSYMMYSFFIRMLIEEFISIFLISVINLTERDLDTWGEAFSYYMSGILLVRKYLIKLFYL